jgi:DivIVA domain-containing protein
MTHDPVAGSAILQKPQFDVAKRGYEKSQVDQYLARVGHDVARTAGTLREERDAARASAQQLMAERDDALRELRGAWQELATLRGASGDGMAAARPTRDEVSIFGERLQTILAAAEQEASAVRAETQQAAEQLRAEAEERAAAALAQATRESEALLARARDEAAETARQAQSQTLQLLEKARREATETLDALRRETDQTRSDLEQLKRLQEQVRHELTGIGAAIEGLLGAADPASASSATM